MISFARCFTGRRWGNIGNGWLAVGFVGFKVDRVWWRKKLIWPRCRG